MTIFFCILLLFQFAKIQWTVELIMLLWFVTKMAYILTGPGDIVNRIVDIAKVVRLCSETVLSFVKFQLNNRPKEWIRNFLNGKLHTWDAENIVILRLSKKMWICYGFHFVVHLLFKILSVENVTKATFTIGTRAL